MTPEEQAAVALYDGPVTICPPGGYEPTFRPLGGSAMTLVKDSGSKKGSKGKST